MLSITYIYQKHSIIDVIFVIKYYYLLDKNEF
jgi:hypothetical protein